VPPVVNDVQADEASQIEAFNKYTEEQDKYIHQLMTELKNDIEQGN